MRVIVTYVAICVIPAAALGLILHAPRMLNAWWQWRIRRRRRLQPAHPPIERLSADLRRLGDDAHAVRAGSDPARHRRLVAVELAYDDVLLECAVALQVGAPAQAPLTHQQRLALEAALLEAGLRW